MGKLARVGNVRGIIINAGCLGCRFRLQHGLAVVHKSDTANGAALMSVVHARVGSKRDKPIALGYSGNYCIMRKGL